MRTYMQQEVVYCFACELDEVPLGFDVCEPHDAYLCPSAGLRAFFRSMTHDLVMQDFGKP